MRRRRKEPRPTCPFCATEIPTPELRFDVYSSEGCLGGRCSCGAAFVIDETGKSGGVAVVDLQTLISDGDLSRAMKLETGRDIEIETRPFPRRSMPSALPRGGYSHLTPKIWFGKLIESEPEG